jgi:hypothetical protein
MKVTVSWDVTLCSLVDHYQYFRVEEKVAVSSKTWVLAGGTKCLNEFIPLS